MAKKTDEMGTDMKIFVWGIAAAVIFSVFVVTVTAVPQECKREGPVVTGIKSASSSSGFLSSGSVCIYETDKGDVSYPCGYKTGDVVSGEIVCDRTGLSIAEKWRGETFP